MTTIDPTTLVRIAELRDVASLRVVQSVLETQMSMLDAQVRQLQNMQKLVNESIDQLG